MRTRKLFSVSLGGGKSLAVGRRSVVPEAVRGVRPGPCKEIAATRAVGAGVSARCFGCTEVVKVGTRTKEDSVKGRRTAVARRASAPLSWSAGPSLGGRG